MKVEIVARERGEQAMQHSSGGAFVAPHLFEGEYHTDTQVHPLLLELRKYPDGRLAIFTVLDQQPLRATSFQALILSRPDCRALSLSHRVALQWNGTAKRAHLREYFIATPDLPSKVAIQLTLSIDNQTYHTSHCETLQEAYSELMAQLKQTATVWLQTCALCHYSWPALAGPGWDDRDELRCLRDALPDLVIEMHEKGKFASQAARTAGEYFVHAFHTCAAWQPFQE
jgi:hypothetical protein